MKTLLNLWKVLLFGLVFILCAVQVGNAQAVTTIQNMIDAAPAGGTVIIPVGEFHETLTINKNITLTGASNSTTLLYPGAANQRVITVTAGHNLTLNSLEVTGGQALDTGGAVYMGGGNLVLNSCMIFNNTAANYGGGVFSTGAGYSVTATNSLIVMNTATNFSGGGLYVQGNAVLTNTNVTYNTAHFHGGGLHVAGSSAHLTGGLINNNTASVGNGGGLNLDNNLTIDGTQFNNNTAGDSGGALTQWNAGQTVTINNAVFNNNSAVKNGGGAFIGSYVTLTGSTFSSNTVNSGSTNANTFGGGVYAPDGINGSHLTFTNNSAKCSNCGISAGGGLYVSRLSTGPSTIQFSTFDGNSAWSGGGISSENAQLSLADSSFTNHNTGIGYGGGVSAAWLEGSRLLFQNNSVINGGGGVSVGTHLVLTNSRFIGNTCTGTGIGTGGGAMEFNQGSFQGTNLLLIENSSSRAAAVYVEKGPAELDFVTIARPTRSNLDPALLVDPGGSLTLKDSIIASYGTAAQVNGTLTEDYNLYFNNGVIFASTGTLHSGGHSLSNQDPLFVNSFAVDYHLSYNSPAIRIGTNLGVTGDLDGRLRTGHWDLGAFQFVIPVYLPMIRR